MENSAVQGNKLYVGGIPYRSTEDDLKKAFGEAGNVVSASIISDRMTGRSRGFGFVEMASEAEAQAAIAEASGAVVAGAADINFPLTYTNARAYARAFVFCIISTVFVQKIPLTETEKSHCGGAFPARSSSQGMSLGFIGGPR